MTSRAFGCESSRYLTMSSLRIAASGPRVALAFAATFAQKETKVSHSFVVRRDATSLARRRFSRCGTLAGSSRSGPRRSIIRAWMVWSWSKSRSSEAGDGGTAWEVPCVELTPRPFAFSGCPSRPIRWRTGTGRRGSRGRRRRRRSRSRPRGASCPRGGGRTVEGRRRQSRAASRRWMRSEDLRRGRVHRRGRVGHDARRRAMRRPSHRASYRPGIDPRRACRGRPR